MTGDLTAENARLRAALMEIADATVDKYEHTYNTGRQEWIGFCRPAETVDVAKAALCLTGADYELCRCGQLTHVKESACIHCGAAKEWSQK